MNYLPAETAIGKPQFRRGTGWGSTFAKQEAEPTGCPRSARYKIEGQWLALKQIENDPRNTNGLSERGIRERINRMELRGKIVHKAPHAKDPSPRRGNYELRWDDITGERAGK